MAAPYTRVFEIQDVFDMWAKIAAYYGGANNKLAQGKVKLKGHSKPIKISSLRIRTFFFKGLTCACCGAKATKFVLEHHTHNNMIVVVNHLNFYAIVDGKEVLMTHDHILARGLGGSDSIENTQTMCEKCNADKGLEEYRLCNETKKKKNIASPEPSCSSGGA